ncbi:hypothetical protein GJ744_001575 [Endocarpon pusillum]|uniref:Uncharacterized protein n=1 Tax=Endocarpon pusillum TaxID=364733 RepID=A0A8H7E1S3_9EURO|nr:hypothetical protein GJ744_001575 [Endocarpon pusillum]
MTQSKRWPQESPHNAGSQRQGQREARGWKGFLQQLHFLYLFPNREITNFRRENGGMDLLAIFLLLTALFKISIPNHTTARQRAVDTKTPPYYGVRLEGQAGAGAGAGTA